jgi:hypothetical protein
VYATLLLCRVRETKAYMKTRLASGGCVCRTVGWQDIDFCVNKGRTADASLGHFTNFPITSEVNFLSEVDQVAEEWRNTDVDSHRRMAGQLRTKGDFLQHGDFHQEDLVGSARFL